MQLWPRFFQAKRREGVLSHFPLHVGLHFQRDLAGSSFSGPDLFDEEVLAKVIAASREDSSLGCAIIYCESVHPPCVSGCQES